MAKKELIKRWFLFIVGLYLTGQGVAFTKIAQLGVSPTSSWANVMSEYFTQLTLGNWLIVWNCILILGQILILRKQFRKIQLLQLPLSFIFGYFTDFAMFLVKPLPVPNYAMRIVYVLIGILILAFGVTLTVIADVVLNSGEGFVKAIADKTGIVFGNVKLGFDAGCVILSVVISLILFRGKIVGTREGTVITATLTGFVVKFWMKVLKPGAEKFIKK